MGEYFILHQFADPIVEYPLNPIKLTMKKAALSCLFLFFTLAWAQGQPFSADEPFSFVGLRLAELIERFGAPKAVFAARGGELWQDDVVFQYDEGDFYIYTDRVWQVRLSSVRGISVRDRKQVALLVMGDDVQDMGDHLLLPLYGNNWPMMFRVNINPAGLVSAIYIYRSDY
jgi:hypothetical protein